jgi:hypothetical protein
MEAQTAASLEAPARLLVAPVLREAASMDKRTSSATRCKFSIIFVYYSPIFFLGFNIPAKTRCGKGNHHSTAEKHIILEARC